MEDEDTHGKKMARKGRTEVIYKGTFVSERSLALANTHSRVHSRASQMAIL